MGRTPRSWGPFWGRPPGRLLAPKQAYHVICKRPTRASAADQGVRPTIGVKSLSSDFVDTTPGESIAA